MPEFLPCRIESASKPKSSLVHTEITRHKNRWSASSSPIWISQEIRQMQISQFYKGRLQYVQIDSHQNKGCFSSGCTQIFSSTIFYTVWNYDMFYQGTNWKCTENALFQNSGYVQIATLFSYTFHLHGCYVKEQQIDRKNRKQKCNKNYKKLEGVENQNICSRLTLGLFEGCNDETENDTSMKLEYEALRQQLLEKDELINDKARECEILKGENSFLEKTCFLLENKLSKLEEKCKKLENDHAELILEFGRLSVENDSKVNKVKKSEQFQKIFLSKSSVTSKAINNVVNINDVENDNSCHSDPTPNVFMSDDGMKALPSSSSSSGEQSARAGSSELLKSSASPGNFQQKGDGNAHAANSRNESDVSAEEIQLSVEVVEGGNTEPISLLSQHSSSIPADVCNAYKLLLLTMSNMLLLTDIMKLQEWAKEMFSIQGNLNAYEVFLELDKKGVITALDLSKFCVFFESIVRHDLVHLINEFMKGDYDKLKKLAYQNKTRNNSNRRVSNSNRVVSSNRVVQPTSNNRGSSERPVRNTRVNVSNAEVDLRNIRVNVSNSQVDLRNSQVNVDNSEVDLRNSQVNVNNSEVDLRNSQVNVNNSEVDLRNSHVNVNNGCHHRRAGRFPDVSAITNSGGNRSNDRNDTSVMTGQVREERTLQHPPSQCNTTHNPTGRCGGTHSHTDAGMHGSSHGNRQDNWLCDHYKRRCLVKFECCDKYWPCHRCHNNLSTCGRRKLKSRDTTMVKCVECGKEQQFGQFCVSCNTQFADFFCGKCKHLTGTDDHPYHCDKCGICRIHGDRSFHCDVCGICLDVQLRGNHKCRPDSAHDECCICLEDAFTGCQILPCSHKVHKECATQMIRSGITRCPICRESFAHKLERRPVKRTTTRRR